MKTKITSIAACVLMMVFAGCSIGLMEKRNTASIVCDGLAEMLRAVETSSEPQATETKYRVEFTWAVAPSKCDGLPEAKEYTLSELGKNPPAVSVSGIPVGEEVQLKITVYVDNEAKYSGLSGKGIVTLDGTDLGTVTLAQVSEAGKAAL